jgi:TatA/E family protein of Tat protein translocase
MGNLGMPELMMIMFLALLLFGPKKLPEIGKQVGKALGEFKRASNDLKRSIEDEMEKANIGTDLKGIMDPPKTDASPAAPVPAIAEGAVSQEKSAAEKPVEATRPS